MHLSSSAHHNPVAQFPPTSGGICVTDIATRADSNPVHESTTVGSLPAAPLGDADMVEEVLVEEVSIDGMCGVY